MASWWYIDNSTLEGQIADAMVQFVFWTIFLSTVRYYLKIMVSTHPFFKHVAAHEGGTDELITWLTCVPQHTISVILLYCGMTFERNDIFRSAVFAEFGYETYDLSRFYLYYFIIDASKTKTDKEKETDLLALKAMTFHHLPGMLMIIPSVHLLGDSPYFRDVVWSLLCYTPCWVTFIALYKCCNINDLNGRTQFAIYYFITLAICIYGRFIWVPMTMYAFIVNVFGSQPLWMKGGLIMYAILIYLFNLLVLLVSCQRLYKYMFVAKTKEAEQVHAVRMLRQTSSNDVFTDFFANGLDVFKNVKVPKKAKFKRHYSEPILN
eukprot:87606_1